MNILYVCTGNSCRSQIAEGWTRHLGGDRVSVRSAGLEAHGINPNAVGTMQAVGIDISHQPSSVLDDADIEWADVVVTVCGHADEHCPLLPPGTQKNPLAVRRPRARQWQRAENRERLRHDPRRHACSRGTTA